MELRTRTTIFAILISAVVALTGATTVHADIYRYVDSQGVLHFTNLPTDGKYRLYMREKPKHDFNAGPAARFDKLIQRAAEAHGVEISLLKAIIKAESDFDPKAVSKRGAMGLMQIMPENLEGFRVANPFDPRENVMAGTRYFKTLFDRFDGRLPLALAAYNAGPTTVDRYRSIPPFPETRRYVEKVMRFYQAFKKG
ncbi:MAG: transglycosylase SLT domain-containing protein [Desulfobacterales bacterium]|nr:transglycosylase SLT domain-containing protein [Desulfobacterales bacterium]